MRSIRKYTRLLSLTLLIIFGESIIAPYAAWALTNGPAAPEFSSFEPVTANTMVDLLTGDGSYVLPALSVPSPEGGYPVSLSYHTGIKMEQESSWVGLGWSLNAGAINRAVVGVADDQQGGNPQDFYQMNGASFQFNRGQAEFDAQSKADIYIPWAGISVGIGMDWGSNKSTGVNFSLSYMGYGGSLGTNGIGFGASSGGFSFGGSIGPKGMGANFGSTDYQVGGNVGLDWNGSVSGGIGMGSMGINLSKYGVSASAFGNGAGIQFGSGVNVVNPNFYVQQKSQFFTTLILNTSYVENVYRAYIFNRDFIYSSGILNISGSYANEVNIGWNKLNKNVRGDSYSNPYDNNIKNTMEDEAHNNLSFPAYDLYSVTAQGLNGSFSPRLLQKGSLYRTGATLDYHPNDPGVDRPSSQELFFADKTAEQFTKASDKIHFYFNDEFSSFYKNTPGTYIWNNPAADDPLQEHDYVGGSENFTTSNGKTYYNSTKQKLGKSKYIEYYKKEDLPTGSTSTIPSGFIDCDGDNNRSQSNIPNSSICAYSVTNEQGVTYHYSLPVWQYESGSVVEKKSDPNEEYGINYNLPPYAYTWLLTAITGPDFVDRGTLGKIDDADYGYWIKFKYGKWSDGYCWRNPALYLGSVTYQTDKIDSKFGRYSFGFKQVYYLNEIETRSHKAVFIKEVRNDGAGMTDGISKNAINFGHQVAPHAEQTYNDVFDGHEFNTLHRYQGQEIKASGTGINYQLFLKKILLFKKQAVINLNSNIVMPQDYSEFRVTKTYNACSNMTNAPTDVGHVALYYSNKRYNHLCQNVYLTANTTYNAGDVISGLSFDYTYQLHARVPNNYGTPQYTSIEDYHFGKLTLTKVKPLARNESQVIPSYNFTYYLDPSTGNDQETSYTSDNVDDWGYEMDVSRFVPGMPNLFCKDGLKKTKGHFSNLKEIITPLGGKIKLNYEQKTYSCEAVFNTIKGGTIPVRYDSQVDNSIPQVLSIPSGINYFNLPDLSSFYKEDLDFSEATIENFELTNSSFGPAETNPMTKAYSNLIKPHISAVAVDLQTNKVALNFDISSLLLAYYGQDIFGRNTSDPSYPNLPNTSGTGFSIKFDLTYKLKQGHGGGIRVSSIECENQAGESYKTTYEYKTTNDLSSGITSFAPKEGNLFVPYVYELPSPGILHSRVVVTSLSTLNTDNGKIIYSFKNYIPSKNADAKEFRMGDEFWVEDIQKGNNDNYELGTNDPTNNGVDDHLPCSIYGGGAGCTRTDRVFARSSVIHDNLSSVGRLVSVETYNKQNECIQKAIYDYYDYTSFEQGLMQETFLDTKAMRNWSFNHDYSNTKWFLTSSSRIKYPSVLKKVTTQNGSISSSTENTGFVFETGEISEQRQSDFKGTQKYSKSVPAFDKYSSMGSKVFSVNNKNMLVQNAATYTYLNDHVDNTTLLSTSVQTWKEDWQYRKYNAGVYSNTTSASSDDAERGIGIWRTYQNWVWKTDLDANGTYTSFTDFNFSGTTQALGWQKMNETTLYSHYSKPLENMDINNNFSATKLGYNNSSVVGIAAGANYTSFAASSFEDADVSTGYFGGEVCAANKVFDAQSYILGYVNTAHTGTKVLKSNLSTGVLVFSGKSSDGFLVNRKYHASVWSDGNSNGKLKVVVQTSGGTNNYFADYAANVNSSAGWRQQNIDFDVPADAIQVNVYLERGSGSETYYDDFRINPASASIASYVYDPVTMQITEILDNNNFFTRYIYDAAGRLTETYRETATGVKKISKTEYHYARE